MKSVLVNMYMCCFMSSLRCWTGYFIFI